MFQSNTQQITPWLLRRSGPQKIKLFRTLGGCKRASGQCWMASSRCQVASGQCCLALGRCCMALGRCWMDSGKYWMAPGRCWLASGRQPLYVPALLSCMSYRQCLALKPRSSLVGLAEMADMAGQGKDCWLSIVQSIERVVKLPSHSSGQFVYLPG